MSAAAGPLPARILVLLAARNGEAWIEQQLVSVLAQQGVEVEIEVRDDDSADRTREVVARMAAADPRVQLWPDHHRTGSAAGNFFRLIEHSDLDTVDWVGFCDQDDVWYPDKIRRAVDCLLNSGAAGYSAAVQARWHDGRHKTLGQSIACTAADHLFEGAGQGCTFVFPVAWFRELQRLLGAHPALLKAVHYHDWALYALTRASGQRWYFDDRAVMDYWQHAANDTGARSSLAGLRRRIRLIRQRWYGDQVQAVCALVLATCPAHAPALRWLSLSRGTAARGLRGRWARLVFVLCHGRRRWADRCVQALAVALGYL